MNPYLNFAAWSLFWILIAAAIAGTVLPIPFLPGSPLVVVAALLHRYTFPTTPSVSWTIIITLAVLAVISLVIDTLTSAIGTKKFGGSRWGILGAMGGALLGLIAGGPLGLFFGPPIGVFAAEYLAVRDQHKAWRATQGAILGMLLGTIGRSIITLLMIALLLWQIFKP
jgi:uncharacterized protein YqgC (DUF456 family)